jgi:hypothetical protein
MGSNPEQGDEANGSFGPAERSRQDQTPGFEAAERQEQGKEEGHLRRSGSAEAPRTGLAERAGE